MVDFSLPNNLAVRIVRGGDNNPGNQTPVAAAQITKFLVTGAPRNWWRRLPGCRSLPTATTSAGLAQNKAPASLGDQGFVLTLLGPLSVELF